MRYFLILLMFIPINVNSEGCRKIDSCNYSSMWSNFSQFTVTYSDKKGGEGTTFDFINTNEESMFTFDAQNGNANLYSINGVATLWRGMGSKGIKTSEKCYKDVGDTHAILQSYAVRALFFVGFGVKGGPELIKNKIKFDIKNKNDIRVQINPGDHMIIGGPWTLKGYVRKKENIEFEILHTFMVEGESQSMFIKGTWKNSPVNISFKDTDSLDEWLVCISGQYSNENGKSEFTPITTDLLKLKTIGDLRALTKSSRGTP